MKKIIEFLYNHYKAFYVFLNIILIIFGFYGMFNLFSNGFTEEQLDDYTVFFCFMFFLVFNSFRRILEILLYKPKSDKE